VPGYDLTIIGASSINDNGWIVALADRNGTDVPVLLKPIAIPELPAQTMVVFGLLALIGSVPLRQKRGRRIYS
jgi:hypothetical protein